MGADAEPVLTLCTPGRHLSIGASQDAAREVDRDACAARGVPVLRREVGGGAVLLGRDQLYFHYVVPRRLAPGGGERLFAQLLAPVLDVHGSFGIPAARRPPGDIVVGERKLGAAAAAELGGAVVLAASFLFAFDRATFAGCVRAPDRARLEADLRQGMATMHELLPEPPSRALVAARFLDAVGAALGVEPVRCRPTPAEAAAIDAAARRHADPGWVWERTPLP